VNRSSACIGQFVSTLGTRRLSAYNIEIVVIVVYYDLYGLKVLRNMHPCGLHDFEKNDTQTEEHINYETHQNMVPLAPLLKNPFKECTLKL
jgi:hypothetical protein